MSAWIVSRAHIDALVNAALPQGGSNLRFWRGEYGQFPTFECTHTNQNDVGQMLVDEIVKSVSYRYPNDNVEAGELPGPCDPYYLKPYAHRIPGAHISAGQLLAAIHCYEYQACEHPEWSSSLAHAFCRALEQRLIRSMPGYDDEPYGALDDEHVKPSNAVSLMSLMRGA